MEVKEILEKIEEVCAKIKNKENGGVAILFLRQELDNLLLLLARRTISETAISHNVKLVHYYYDTH